MPDETLDGLEDLKMLTTSELAKLLHTQTGTLRSWRKRAIGPTYIKGEGLRGQVRYMVKDVRNWINSRRTPTGINL